MSLEAMKMALEALEMFCEHGAILRPLETVETLRQAIEQAEKQEPVAIVNEGMGGIEWLSKPLPDDTPLYAAPPKREPLMTKYVIDLWDEYGLDPIKFAREIEAAHGIKENT